MTLALSTINTNVHMHIVSPLLPSLHSFFLLLSYLKICLAKIYIIIYIYICIYTHIHIPDSLIFLDICDEISILFLYVDYCCFSNFDILFCSHRYNIYKNIYFSGEKPRIWYFCIEAGLTFKQMPNIWQAKALSKRIFYYALSICSDFMPTLERRPFFRSLCIVW